MFYKKFCNYRVRRRQANQRAGYTGADSRSNHSVSAYLAWNIGPAKFQCCIITFLNLVYNSIASSVD